MPALVIPALVGLGLIAGLLREVFLAHLFGTSREIEVFRVAFGMPSILSESLAISFVSVLIPVLLSDQGTFALRRSVWTTALLAGIVLLVGIVTMPLQARLLAPGIVGDDRMALIAAGVLCWGMFFLSILSLPLRALMSIENRVWPGASAAFLRSGGFVMALGTLVVFGWRPAAETAALAALAAGLCVLVIHVLALGPGGRERLIEALRAGPPGFGYRPLLNGLLLVFGMQLLLSGGRLLDRVIASTMSVGTLAAIEYSYAFLMAVAAVIGTSANILLAPRLGRALKETGRVPVRYWRIVAVVTGVAVVAGVALALLVVPVIRSVLEYGAFTADDTALTARVLRLHALALGPLVLALILTQILILSGAQRWLVPVAGIKLAVKAMALWLLIRIGLGLEGIAISLGIAECGTALILGIVVSRRIRQVSVGRR